MSYRVLITGGAGFVGSHLTDGLLAAGHHVRILDNLTPQVHGDGVPSYLSPEAELVEGDIRNRTIVDKVLRDIDVIFHFAATVGVGQSMYEISRYTAVNTLGTAELLQGLLDSKRAIKKLIVASSMSIYGEGRYACSACRQETAPAVRPVDQLRAGEWNLFCEDCGELLEPRATSENKPSEINSIYALGKRDQEEMCLMFGRTYALPVTALRFFNIYGTRQALSNPYTGVAAIFASRMLNGQAPLVFEDGEQMRDFVSVHDVVDANLLAMERSASDGMVINIGSGRPVTISQVAEMLACALGKDIAPVVTGKYRAGDIRHCYADISRARKLLGYEPRVSHRDGFEELGDWLHSQTAEDKAETMMQQLTAYGLTA
ncbi:MAG TPA: NAD-dependent epimerase/dehydratase family protein [Acidobacteriaceae bacterium]|jgi:dTDP-L-rhamnose 4-epimerase